MGVGGLPGAVEISCRRVQAQSSAWDSNISQFERTSAIAKHGFNVKSCETMVWIWCYSKGAERSIVSRLDGRSSRFMSLMAVYCQKTCQHWWLTRAFETACGPPMAKGRIQTKNTSFSGFSSGLHRKNHPAAIGRILDSSRLVAIFAGLELLDFSIWSIVQVKVQVTPHANQAALCLSITVEWDQLMAVHICSFYCRREVVIAGKWCLHWIDS